MKRKRSSAACCSRFVNCIFHCRRKPARSVIPQTPKLHPWLCTNGLKIPFRLSAARLPDWRRRGPKNSSFVEFLLGPATAARNASKATRSRKRGPPGFQCRTLLRFLTAPLSIANEASKMLETSSFPVSFPFVSRFHAKGLARETRFYGLPVSL